MVLRVSDALWLFVLRGYFEMCINKDSLQNWICLSVPLFVPGLDGSPGDSLIGILLSCTYRGP